MTPLQVQSSTNRWLREDEVPPGLPLMLKWGGSDAPVPIKAVSPRGKKGALVIGTEAPPWLPTGPHDRPFDFSGFMQRLCKDLAARCPTLAHIAVDRLLIGFTQARGGHRHGLQARVTPLRFRGGQLLRQRGRNTYHVQRYVVDDREILYLVTFCLPRFLNQDFDDKFVTVLHELYHISPAFDGDLRRHQGRCSIHTHSKREYDAHMAELAQEYLQGKPDPALHAFMRLNFAQLEKRHGGVEGIVVPRPKLIPVMVVRK